MSVFATSCTSGSTNASDGADALGPRVSRRPFEVQEVLRGTATGVDEVGESRQRASHETPEYATSGDDVGVVLGEPRRPQQGCVWLIVLQPMAPVALLRG